MKVSSFNLPHLYLVTPLAMTLFEFCGDLRCQKIKSPWAIAWHYLRDPTFSHFSRILTCDRQTRLRLA